MCDGRTVDSSDLVETDHVRRHYSGSTLYLMHNPAQRFYYMSKQSKNEVLIFKNFDSKPDVEAKCKYSRPGCRPLSLFFLFSSIWISSPRVQSYSKKNKKIELAFCCSGWFLNCKYRRAARLLPPSSLHSQHNAARKHRSPSLCFYVSI